MKNRPNKAPEPTPTSVTPRATESTLKRRIRIQFRLRHAARQMPSWLIFDVRQKMSTPREVLHWHAQYYHDSCAASGMEMLLKLHDLEPRGFRGLQDRYGDTNIGFEKLADLLPYGIKAKDHDPLLEEGFAKIEAEARAGEFPLVSLKGSVKWHIWVAVIEEDRLRFLSRDFRNLDSGVRE